MKQKPKAKVGCLVRVSTKDRQDTRSQKLAIRNWASFNHVPTSELQWYEDKQSGKTVNRNGLNRLLKHVQQGKVDVVVMYDLSRLARNLQEGIRVLADLAKQVRVVSVHENIDFNSTSGQLIAAILLALAEWQRKTLCEKTRLGMQAAKVNGTRSGKPIGRPRDDKRLDRIQKMRETLSVQEIADKLKITRQAVYGALSRATLKTAV